MKANPLSVALMAASVSASSPIPSPATKKSAAVLVLRVAHTPMAPTMTK